MKNHNALISMAQVSQNANNPFFAFCEYLKYCIFSNSSNVMTIGEIQHAVGEEFGIYLPHNITLTCLEIIKKEKLISIDNYKIKRIGIYDTESFNQKRETYRATENELIKLLIDYLKQYNKEWTYEYAREQLIKVLDRKGLAYNIFVLGEVSLFDNDASSESEATTMEEMSIDEEAEIDDDNQPLFNDSYFVGEFIEKTLSTSTIQKDYLLKICEGLMLCAGAYQLPASDAEVVSSDIKGTSFIFDTRLLLRFVGCAGDAAVEATQELVKLIQKNGGSISYYQQTLEEINRAFDDATKSIDHGYPPRDSEMRLFASKKLNNITLINSKKASISQELAKAGISLKLNVNYSNKEKLRFGFDCLELQQYMQSVLQWDSKTIENDASSIWETHMARRGDYSEYFGGSNKLPVFVTSNTKLISVALHFRNQRENVKTIFLWNSNRLPIISDVRLTCRLWSPAEDCERISLLYLTSNAVAAQNLTQKYIRSIRKLAIELEKTSPEYSGISLPSYFDDNFTKAFVKYAKGQDDNLNIGNLVNTLNELSELKAKEQEEKTKKVTSERDELSNKIDIQTTSIIEGAVKINKNKMGIISLLLRILLLWPIVISLIFAGIGAIISQAIGNWHIVWLALIPMLVKVFELVFSSKLIEKALIQIIYSKAQKSFMKHIEKNLRMAEIPYKDIIIERVMNETNLWKKVCSLMEK